MINNMLKRISKLYKSKKAEALMYEIVDLNYHPGDL